MKQLIHASSLLMLLSGHVMADLEFTGEARPPLQPLSLWYRQPAREWTEALPIGNGRIAAMIFGGVTQERLQLNEGTVWSGAPYDPTNPEGKAALPEIRQLVRDGKYGDAAKLISGKFMALPPKQASYQLIGDLNLTFPDTPKVEGYRRELDLDTATAKVSYSSGGVHFTREMFASAPGNVIVLRLTADKPGSISFSAGMSTPMTATVQTAGDDTLVMQGQGGGFSGVKGAIQYQSRIKVVTKGGKTHAENDRISVSGADEATLVIAAATNYRSYQDLGGDPEALVKGRITARQGKSYAALLAEHVKDYQALFHRVRLDLGTSDSVKLPTDERIKSFGMGGDPQLAAIYYQYGRYLLISSSRPGGQPAGLQGLWNDKTNPPWGGKYTININTEMNYWPAESGNLAECVEPLISMVQDLSVTGARTAAGQYGARGWVAHHNTDLWRATGPIDGPNWGMWPTGGAWLCLHLWDRYEFSGDPAVLKRIYPVLKGACEFFLDTLQDDPTHQWLVTNPSISPENNHPFGAAVCTGPTMDMQILRDLFANTIRASELLQQDADFRQQLVTARGRLAPNKIGQQGQLQEWLEDWDAMAKDQHHRHVSHLYGLFPGRDLSLRGTPELAAAVKKSLEIRGDKATGWATAWRICLWTHLGDGDHAFSILKFLLSPERTYPNMFDAHPPFQIDGNFGGAAGIVEMLMQSRSGEIELLPALPSAWPDGSIAGLRARGGFEVSLKWKAHKLVSATVKSLKGEAVTLRYGTATKPLKLAAGQTISWSGE
jgi:alpha-L-fucosidase 2